MLARCLSIHATAATITSMVAQPNPIESLLGAEWLVRVQRMMATGIFRTFGIGQEVKLLSIDTLEDAMREGNLRFWDSSHFFCIKGSSPTKRSCIRRRRSCLHDSLVHMQRTVDQRVLGTSEGKNNKDTMFGWFDSRNTFHSTPFQS